MLNAWYYVENDTQTGPVDDAQIRQLIANGAIAQGTLVWQEGMGDWAEARNHFDFTSTAVPADVGGQDHGHTTGPDGLYTGAPSRGFAEAISVCFKKYVGFSGRASRSEYWFWILFTVLAGIAVQVFDAVIFATVMDTGPLGAVFSLVIFLPGFAVAFRRLHDINRTGWWIGGFYGAVLGLGFGLFVIANANLVGPDVLLIALAVAAAVILAYFVLMLVFLCGAGDKTRNRYG